MTVAPPAAETSAAISPAGPAPMTATSGKVVIPGRASSRGPQMRSAHWGFSRFSGAQLRTIVRCCASPPNDVSQFRPFARGGVADIFLGLLERTLQRLRRRHVADLLEM